MRSMQNIKRVATVTLVSLIAFSAQAANDNGNNGSRSGEVKKEQQIKEEKDKRTVSVPEPAMFTLLGVGVAALGMTAWMRRRKDH